MSSEVRIRLGQIEKYIVTWALRNDGYTSDQYASKSGVLLSYARRKLGYDVTPLPVSVKAVLPGPRYRSLHASFSRALRRLVGCKLIDLSDRETVINARKTSDRVPSSVSSYLSRRDTFYSLTPLGRRLARQLLYQGYDTQSLEHPSLKPGPDGIV